MPTAVHRALGVQTGADLIEQIEADAAAAREAQATQLPAIQDQLGSTKGRAAKVLPPKRGQVIPHQGRR